LKTIADFNQFSSRQVDALLLYFGALLLAVGARLLTVGAILKRSELSRHPLDGMSEFGQLTGRARDVLVGCDFAAILRGKSPSASQGNPARRSVSLRVPRRAAGVRSTCAFSCQLVLRVRWRKATAVAIPSNQPRTVAASMIHTSDACVEPMTQSNFTARVFAEMRTTSTAKDATASPAHA